MREEPLVNPWKPSKAQVAEAQDRTVPDLVAPGLKVWFSGINPSLYSAAVGHHFARPGNRFWPTLERAGYTPRLFSAFEDRTLVELGYGITNVVDRATAKAAEVTTEEFIEGGRALEAKVKRFRPRFIAFLGITAYRSAFNRPLAQVGLQEEKIARTRLWVLPNPSGLNAHYQLNDLARLFQSLREAAEG